MRKVVSYLILIVGIYLLVNIGRNLWKTWHAQDLVEEERQAVEKLAEENQQLKDRLDEVSTDEFVEKQAREQLNMVKPGETVVLIPEELMNVDYGMKEENEEKPEPEPNWKQWWRVFWEGEAENF